MSEKPAEFDADTIRAAMTKPAAVVAQHVHSCIEMRDNGVIASSLHVTKTPEGRCLFTMTSYSPGGPFNCEIAAEDVAQFIARLAVFLPPEEPDAAGDGQ